MVAELDLSGIIVIVGNYGSGKTEVSINLAVDQKTKGRTVQLADLDLVNPYFRTREARQALSALGIEMVLPPQALRQADLPILVPQVAGLIRQPGDLAILDAGGDDVGATVLAALADAFQHAAQPVRVLQVINPFRPNTQTVQGCLSMRAAIEAAARLPVSGWVGNAHLMAETTLEHIQYGYELMVALAHASRLPLAFMAVAQDLLAGAAADHWNCPVLPIRRQLVPPWEKAYPLFQKE
jgi:hypothetical protein